MKKIFVACMTASMCFFAGIDSNVCESTEISSIKTEYAGDLSQSGKYELLRKVFDADGRMDFLTEYQYVNEAIAKYPDVAFFYYLRSDLSKHPKINKREDEIKNLDKAIELDPNFSRAYESRGYYYYKQKQYDKALEDYDKEIELAPGSAFPYRMRSIIHKTRGEKDKVFEDDNKVIELAPDYSVIEQYARASVYYSKGKYDDAISDCTRVIVVCEKIKKAREKNKSYLGGSLIRVDGGYYTPLPGTGEELFKVLETASAEAVWPMAHTLRGNAYYAQGKYQEALDDARKAAAQKVGAKEAEALIEKAEAALKSK